MKWVSRMPSWSVWMPSGVDGPASTRRFSQRARQNSFGVTVPMRLRLRRRVAAVVAVTIEHLQNVSAQRVWTARLTAGKRPRARGKKPRSHPALTGRRLLGSVQVLGQLAADAGAAQLAQRLGLDLADAL